MLNGSHRMNGFIKCILFYQFPLINQIIHPMTKKLITFIVFRRMTNFVTN